MQYYILKFSIRVGEVEQLLQRLVKVRDDKSIEEAIHDTLHNWWGDETVTEKKGEHYHQQWQQSLKLEETRRINEEEYQTMKGLVMEW